MDIYNRIIEAIAEKLVSVRLDEVTWDQIVAARQRRAKQAGRKAGQEEGFGYNRDIPASERPKISRLSGEEAGVSAPAVRPGYLSTGPDPEKAKSTPIRSVKPSEETEKRLKGGKEGIPGLHT